MKSESGPVSDKSQAGRRQAMSKGIELETAYSKDVGGQLSVAGVGGNRPSEYAI
jgi:hypothetical protein